MQPKFVITLEQLRAATANLPDETPLCVVYDGMLVPLVQLGESADVSDALRDEDRTPLPPRAGLVFAQDADTEEDDLSGFVDRITIPVRAR